MTQDNRSQKEGQSEIFKEVFLFANGNAVGFDAAGQQIPLIQGNIDRVKDILIPAMKAHNPIIHDYGNKLQTLLSEQND